MRSIVRNVLLILLGSLIFALAVNLVILPNGLGEGGVTGITVLLYYVFDIPPAITNLVANAIILTFGWRFLDKKTIGYTFLAVIAMSVFLQIITPPPFIPENTMIAGVTAGIMIGSGIGIVVLGSGTTAGSDIIALVLKKYFGMNISMSLLLIDVLVVIPLFFVIGPEMGILTLITLFISSRVLNYILEGLNPKKQLIIVSKDYEEIAAQIQTKIGRGITVLNGYGYYSKTEKNVLYIVVNRLQLMPTERIIHEIDPNAFVTVTTIQQVIGEGFTFHLDDQSE